MKDEGYIKYQPIWQKTGIDVERNVLDEMNRVRRVLKEQGWLGVLPDGIGFGNLSVRIGNTGHFLISGSGTGNLESLRSRDFAMVNDVDITENQLSCRGLTKASSESMTHAVFYRFSDKVKGVIHIHDKRLWKKYYNVLPTSWVEASYGTPEMAFSIEKLLKRENLKSGIIVMGGHEDGIVAFGRSMDEAYEILRLHKI
ncbi:MAG: class II aldolase/adducin family protein [Prolixibacteraceae bacterium]|jgi:L-ribulose-5-phosphate 4-epimerase|nr:class II aldolase/adducin family protein [Prolixibacteraceae bacterium]